MVPTFKLPLGPADDAALDKANVVLGTCGSDPAGHRTDALTEKKKLTVAGGKTATISDLDGPGAITAIRVRVKGLPEGIASQATFLRKLAIRITWDGESEPSVWSPLGDFFADAAGAASYLSLPTGLTNDGWFYGYWYIALRETREGGDSNDGGTAAAMDWEVVHVPLAKSTADLLRFHAKWHRDAFLPDRTDRAPDWTLLVTQGAGRYVGTQLHIWNPAGDWWGRGGMRSSSSTARSPPPRSARGPRTISDTRGELARPSTSRCTARP